VLILDAVKLLGQTCQMRGQVSPSHLGSIIE
jgi:hypothetical protein